MSDSHRKQRQRFWMVKYFVWLFALLVLLLFFVLPLLTNVALRYDYFSESVLRWLGVIQWLQTFVMHAFVYLWITFLGSCFASFLNVVAWRVPRGRSILGSSHCPNCDSKLSMIENVPVFGWLNNDGQCRSCGNRIAVRYLIVEVLLGLTFLLLFLVEVVWGGVNLPVRPEIRQFGIEFLLFTPNWFLILTFAYHATLMCGLFTFAVIASEHKRVPVIVTFFAAVILMAIASTWPHVIQIPWTAGVAEVKNWPHEQFSKTSLYTIAIGLCAGVAAGLIAWGLDAMGAANFPQRDENQNEQPQLAQIKRSSMVASMGLVGLALGWQSAVLVLVLWFGCRPILRLLAPTRLLPLVSNGSAVMMFATILHIIFWRLQMPINFWLNG